MLNWINFLHIYQPPTQDRETLKKVFEESYSQIPNLLDGYPKFKITLNITGTLLEKFQEKDFGNLLERINRYVSEGRIELVSSAFFHPILPLMPESEVRHQIKLGLEKGKEIFGESYKPRGFFFPEMAYNKKVAEIVKEFGFDWIILDEMHLYPQKPNSSVRYEVKDVGLGVLFRDRKYSKGFPPELIVKNLDKIQEKYLITAHDGEMYGYWHKDFQNFYKQAFDNEKINFLTVSEYLSELDNNKETVEPIEANWESSVEEIKNNNPFALWNSPENIIQNQLWIFFEAIYSIIQENQNDSNYSWAKKHFDRGTPSCFWWWASNKKIDVFSPISWNPTDIEKGLEEMVKSIRSLKKLQKSKRLEIEKKHADLLELIWGTHWDRQS